MYGYVIMIHAAYRFVVVIKKDGITSDRKGKK